MSQISMKTVLMNPWVYWRYWRLCTPG